MRATLLIFVLAFTFQTSPPPAYRSKQQEPAHTEQKSTEKAPSQSVVTVPNNQNQSAEKKNSSPNEAKQRPEKPPWWDASWATWALVIVGFVGAVVAIWTLLLVKRQSKDTKISADAAKKSADAALLSAEAAIRADRAWLMADLQWRDRVRIITNRGTEGESTTVDLNFLCKNDGNTPAWISQIFVRVEILASFPQVPIYEPIELRDFIELRPIPVTVGGEYKAEVACRCSGTQSQEKTLMIYGRVKYRDAFDFNRETRFGYTLDSRRALERIVDPEYNKNT